MVPQMFVGTAVKSEVYSHSGDPQTLLTSNCVCQACRRRRRCLSTLLAPPPFSEDLHPKPGDTKCYHIMPKYLLNIARKPQTGWTELSTATERCRELRKGFAISLQPIMAAIPRTGGRGLQLQELNGSKSILNRERNKNKLGCFIDYKPPSAPAITKPDTEGKVPTA